MARKPYTSAHHVGAIFHADTDRFAVYFAHRKFERGTCHVWFDIKTMRPLIGRYGGVYHVNRTVSPEGAAKVETDHSTRRTDTVEGTAVLAEIQAWVDRSAKDEIDAIFLALAEKEHRRLTEAARERAVRLAEIAGPHSLATLRLVKNFIDARGGSALIDMDTPAYQAIAKAIERAETEPKEATL